MAERFVFEEDFGWLTKIIRSIICSATTGFLWVLPWIVFVILGAFYFDFAEARMPVEAREYDGFGIGLVFYGVSFCVPIVFLVGICLGFTVGLESDGGKSFWPFHIPLICNSFRSVDYIILVMFVGGGVACLSEII